MAKNSVNTWHIVKNREDAVLSVSSLSCIKTCYIYIYSMPKADRNGGEFSWNTSLPENDFKPL